ncbi:MAG TPA: glycosyltransferase family 4 protein [Armatimonadota bacterium]|nr:glycosyltransferase family 4 protein [Armatimonadota bacterium]
MPSTPKIAVVWSRMPGYAQACLAELAAIIGDGLWCASIGDPPPHAPQEPAFAGRPATIFSRDGAPRPVADAILGELTAFKPDVLIATGWSLPAVRLVARELRGEGVVTVCMADTPWTGALRQVVRCLVGRRLLRQCYDVMWVPGARALPLAQLAGFDPPHVWQGLYTADSATFAAGTPGRLDSARAESAWPRQFLFVGRLAPEKNVGRLLDGYRRYREDASEPWPLVCVGDGPERAAAESEPGVECKGWLEPPEVAELMQRSGCFILPSTYEPWGVVVHEAACAGLPLIASSTVGATAELVRDGHNGCLIDPRDCVDIARGFRWIASHDSPQTLGERSYELSLQLSPKIWADSLMRRLRNFTASRE